ncbi:MAG: hypothetical protein JWM11_3892 [Planctomycetaceae bacterium]|nr:hypothetical protein [Planctomycetaceae bacterium]
MFIYLLTISMLHGFESSDPYDALITRLEEERMSTGRLSCNRQEELRDQLTKGRQTMSGDDIRRIGLLLNPRGANVIDLSDATFHSHYRRVVEDNYSNEYLSFADRMAEYDAGHGFYVSLRTDLID